MNFKTLLSFRGRATPKDYWMTYWAVAGGFIVMPLSAVVGMPFGKPTGLFVSVGLLAAYAIVTLCIGLAVSVRRLHDRNKSAWWMVPYWAVPLALGYAGANLIGGKAGAFVGFAGMMVFGAALVEFGCLQGTAGPNAYGPDPVDGRATPPPLPANATTPTSA